MNSYQRLMARLQGKPVDKIPNLSILMGFAARYAGVCYRDFCRCPEAMVRANIQCHEELGQDIVTVMSDPYAEAMDQGVRVEFPESENPRCLQTLWADVPDAASLRELEVSQSPRMADRMQTIRLYARQLKGQCPIAGWVEGPVAEYCDLRGINEALMDMAGEEEFLPDILDKITRQAIYYIEEQVRAGADIIGIGDAACSLIGPELYRWYALPYEKRMVEAAHRAGALVKLHICGNTTPLLADIARLHVDIFDVDSMVNFAQAEAALRGISSVCGNLNPVETLLRGTPEQIRDAVAQCLRDGGDRCLISGGCETPPFTPVENHLALDRALWIG